MLATNREGDQEKPLNEAIVRTGDQLERLHTMLHQARFLRNDEFELHLRIEEKIQNTVKLLLELKEREKSTGRHDEAPDDATTEVLLSALDDYPEAKVAFGEILKSVRGK